jgi:hypothetical protein
MNNSVETTTCRWKYVSPLLQGLANVACDCAMAQYCLAELEAVKHPSSSVAINFSKVLCKAEDYSCAPSK